MRTWVRLIFIFALIPQLAMAGTRFNCQQFLTHAKEDFPDTSDPLGLSVHRFTERDNPASFEEVLGWIAHMMGENKQRFIEKVQEEMAEKDEDNLPKRQGPDPKDLVPIYIIREKPNKFMEIFARKDSIRYLERVPRSRDIRTFAYLFEAIQKLFSYDIGGKKRWRAADTDEKEQIAARFTTQAVRVLFFQYLLYLQVRADMPNEDVKVPRLVDIKTTKKKKRELRILASEKEHSLFDTVTLSNELVKRLNSVSEGLTGEPWEDAVTHELDNYVTNKFINNFDKVYNTKPKGLVKPGAVVTGVLIGIGVFAAIYEWKPRLPFPISETPQFNDVLSAQKSDVDLHPPAISQTQIRKITPPPKQSTEAQSIMKRAVQGD